MSAKEKNEMIIPDSKVESLFIELENIFDNYDGYDRRLKAYEIINTALYPSKGKQQASTTSKCNKHIVSKSETEACEHKNAYPVLLAEYCPDCDTFID